MNVIDEVVIEGFWGTNTLELKLNGDVNFLVGVNGTGKTTAIDLIAAALRADFTTLDRLSFRRMLIGLRDPRGRKKPLIQIEKNSDRLKPFPDITYKIRDSRGGEDRVYDLDEYEVQRSVRHYPPGRARDYMRGFVRDGAAEHLSRLVNVNWLSVHRTPRRPEPRSETSYSYAVDARLRELRDDLARYFSTLEKAKAEHTNSFVKAVFATLVPDPAATQDFFAIAKKVELDEEKSALRKVFDQFGVRGMGDVDAYFDRLEKAIEPNTGSWTSQQVVDITSVIRIENIVRKWKHAVERHEEIDRNKEIFIDLINEMFGSKSIVVSDTNDIVFKMGREMNIPLERLSSGEKQLLIILGEALLQQREPWVYIADEPELSLHVTWQDKLVRNLRAVNPSAQILFATHSPDIVSAYSSRVFSMRDVLA